MAFVVLFWFSVVAAIVGANLPGLGIAAAVGLGWLLLRYLPGLQDAPDAASDPPGDDHDQRSGEQAPGRRPE